MLFVGCVVVVAGRSWLLRGVCCLRFLFDVCCLVFLVWPLLFIVFVVCCVLGVECLFVACCSQFVVRQVMCVA